MPTASLQRGKMLPQSVSGIWHQTVSDGEAPVLKKGEYPLITIVLRLVQIQSGSTC